MADDSKPRHARARLLLVEDDLAIANGIALNLRLEGFEAEIVSEGEAVAEAVERFRPDLVLLDITLPRRSGLDVLADLRERPDRSRLPVIVVSARQNEFDKVTALRLGADDYVTKPFGVAELLARIEAVLRRTTPAEKVEPAPADDSDDQHGYAFGDVTLDIESHEVLRAGQPVTLTHREFELARFFAENPRRVFPRETLLARVWGTTHATLRTVDNFVGQLRSKLEADPTKPRHFLTVRGEGYRFVPD